MEEYNPYRIMGRIEGLIGYIMNKYGLKLSDGQEVPSPPTMLMALSLKVDEPDKSLCTRLADIYVRMNESASLMNEQPHLIDEQVLKGRDEANYIFTHFPAEIIAGKVLEHTDYKSLMQSEISQRHKREKRQIAAIGFSLIAIIIGICVYNLPYFAEKRAFASVEKAMNDPYHNDVMSEIDSYLLEYPQGPHAEEVEMIRIKTYLKEDQKIKALEFITDFLNSHYEGKNVEECKKIYDDIWNEEIRRYKEKTAEIKDREGVDFVISMLEYMKKTCTRKVNVIAESKLNLKEYSDYPKEIRDFLEFHQDEFNDSKLRLPGDIISITDQISEEQTNQWIDYIVESLNKGFNNVLSEGLIEFVVENPESIKNEKNPVVYVKYKVSTNEIDGGIPDIWIYYTQKFYTQNEILNTKSDQCLMLGIAIDFNAQFSIPAEDKTYTISEKSTPGTEDIQGDKSVIYERMCERCTDQFSEKMVRLLGLPETKIEINAPTEDSAYIP